MKISIENNQSSKFDSFDVLFVYFFNTLLIFIGTKYGIVSLVPFGILCVTIWIASEQLVLESMVYYLSFALIFKLSPDAMSLYTYLLILYVLKKIINRRIIPMNIIMFIIYIIFVQLINQSVEILRTVKLVCNFLFVYFAFNCEEEVNTDRVMLSYILGVVVSSIISMLPDSIFILTPYIGEDIVYGEMIRFSGLNNDPNFYSISLIFSLSFLVFFYRRKYLSNFTIICISCFLVLCAIKTYSKSVFLMLFFPFLMFVRANHKMNKYFIQIITISAIVIVMILFLQGKIAALDTIRERLFKSNGDVSDLTTGRSKVWVKYIDYYRSHLIEFIIGRGMNASLIGEKFAHCIYIDTPNYIGLLGEIFFIDVYRKILKEHFLSSEITAYFPLISLCIMYAFLPGLFDYQLPLFLLLSFFSAESLFGTSTSIERG